MFCNIVLPEVKQHFEPTSLRLQGIPQSLDRDCFGLRLSQSFLLQMFHLVIFLFIFFSNSHSNKEGYREDAHVCLTVQIQAPLHISVGTWKQGSYFFFDSPSHRALGYCVCANKKGHRWSVSAAKAVSVCMFYIHLLECDNIWGTKEMNWLICWGLVYQDLVVCKLLSKNVGLSRAWDDYGIRE